MLPPSHPVRQMIDGDLARLIELQLGDHLALFRFRKPVLGGDEAVPGYPFRLSILWPYAEADSGALPSPHAMDEMDAFEEHLFHALGHDAHAVWVAVLTFDGARQWLLYTSDVAECGRRLNAMPHKSGRYPIQLEADHDPHWLYLREQILGQIDFED